MATTTVSGSCTTTTRLTAVVTTPLRRSASARRPASVATASDSCVTATTSTEEVTSALQRSASARRPANTQRQVPSSSIDADGASSNNGVVAAAVGARPPRASPRLDSGRTRAGASEPAPREPPLHNPGVHVHALAHIHLQRRNKRTRTCTHGPCACSRRCLIPSESLLCGGLRFPPDALICALSCLSTLPR